MARTPTQQQHDLCYIHLPTGKTAYRWVREQGGVRYILYKGSIWSVTKRGIDWQLGRILILM